MNFKKVPLNRYIPWIIFFVGLWVAVIQNMGPELTYIPGDLIDNRFNNYILEHFYRWVVDRNSSYWNAKIFYPFSNTIAFSDNLLGTAPLYASFRGLGLDRETAFQVWYIFGFFLNFSSSFYILQKITPVSLASGVGAFFYSFGLPLMAQEGHAQLLYRCGVPIACYFLWDFYEKPKLWKIFLVVLSFVWQFYASIYSGIFLGLLLLAILILLPFFLSNQQEISPLSIFPKKLQDAWKKTLPIWRIIFLTSVIALFTALFALLQPYYLSAKVYGFARTLSDIYYMLPRPESYFLSDRSLLWGKLSASFQSIEYMRWEHQLFPGLSVIILIISSLIWHPKLESRDLAWLHFGAMLILMGVTFNFNGYTIYRLLVIIPGMNSIRAVTRIILILMWPISVFITSVLTSMLEIPSSNKTKNAPAFAYLLISLLLIETLAFNHSHISKVVAQSRLTEIKNMLPVELPQEPILVLGTDNRKTWQLDALDAMLVAQDLGWSTLNGYSGNFPNGYSPPSTCQDISELIYAYMRFEGITNQQFYFKTAKRIVPIGFIDCELPK